MTKPTEKWIKQTPRQEILAAFLFPKTPGQVQRELEIKKFNLRPFLTRGLLRCLCPDNSKGRLYVSTNKARKLLDPTLSNIRISHDTAMLGWIMASPKQRLVVLKTMAVYGRKMTSEEIRLRSKKLNPCLSRISTKNILNELISKGLVETEMGNNRRRYYWINDSGKACVEFLSNTSNSNASLS